MKQKVDLKRAVERYEELKKQVHKDMQELQKIKEDSHSENENPQFKPEGTN